MERRARGGRNQKGKRKWPEIIIVPDAVKGTKVDLDGKDCQTSSCEGQEVA